MAHFCAKLHSFHGCSPPRSKEVPLTVPELEAPTRSRQLLDGSFGDVRHEANNRENDNAGKHAGGRINDTDDDGISVEEKKKVVFKAVAVNGW